MKTRFDPITLLIAIVLITGGMFAGRGMAAPNTAPAAAAVTTQFIYEGRLGNVTGTYDLYFRLWTAASGGTLVGSPNTMLVNDRPVTQGEYQAVLNFGPTAFVGDARYLEVRYRIGTSTGTYTVQPGRQPILPVAYALSLRPGATVNGNVTNPGAMVSGVNTGTGAGLYGSSTSGSGVWGKSTSGAGLYGESTSWLGVHGVSSTQTGVLGKSTTFTGVWGESRDWIGVYGQSTSQSGVAGKSTVGAGAVGESRDHFGVYGTSTRSDGVHGIAQAGGKAGVVGVNNGGGAGYGVYGLSNNVGLWGVGTNNAGVYGTSTNGHGVQAVVNNPNTAGVWAVNNAGGYALSASGNASQSLASGGFIKAMALIDPYDRADPVKQCFNGQLAGTQATNGNCGISVNLGSTCNFSRDINFGFDVSNRIVTVTPFENPRGYIGANLTYVGSNTVSVVTFYATIDSDVSATCAKFFIVVY